MIWKKHISPFLTATLFYAVAPLFCGCSDDSPASAENDFETGIPASVGISIGTMRGNSVRAGDSTGDGTPASPSDNNEMINSWWIAFVNDDGVISDILDRSSNLTDAVEMESFRCTIPSGNYDIYAFANIDRETLKTETGIDFKKGSEIVPEDVESAVWRSSLNNWDSSKPIPMSGFLKRVKIKNTVEENFSIEVVRMVAKVEFRFDNSSSEDVIIHNISIDPVTDSSISLFPRGAAGISYSHLGNSPYSPLTGAGYHKLLLSLDIGNRIGAGEKLDRSFYIQESVSDRANDNAFTIGLNVSHDNGVSEFEQCNITRDILTYINRNDYIVIPVTLSRYDVKVEALFYPPIGGYPALTSAFDPEGAQIFTFGTQGDFEIATTVTDKQTGTHLAPVYYNITLSDISDPQGIFSKTPALTGTSSSFPDEVTGTLNANKGKATLEFTVNIYDKPGYQAGARITNSYTRKIYIIRN